LDLQVTKLSKLLATVVKFASKWLDLLMNDFVCANVTPLRKGFTANVATIRSLSSVSPFVCLYESDVY